MTKTTCEFCRTENPTPLMDSKFATMTVNITEHFSTMDIYYKETGETSFVDIDRCPKCESEVR